MTDIEPIEEPSIWDVLQLWGGQLDSWQRIVLSYAIDHGTLTENEIDQAYSELVAPAPDGLSIVIPHGRGAAATETPIALERIEDLSNVNALPEGTSLTFGPGLTIIYGRNGTGKTGFARVLANACFSRHKPQVLPNIDSDAGAEGYSANFFLKVGDEVRGPIPFTGSENIPELKRIAMFDAFVAKHHISQPNAFEFRPVGFDVFTEMARVYAELARRLEAEIATRSSTVDFAASFIGLDTEISTAMSAVDASSDLARLRALAQYGDGERARLATIDQQITALKSQSTAEAVSRLGEAREDVSLLIGRLTALSAEFSQSNAEVREGLRAQYSDATAHAAMVGSDMFKRPFFSAIGSVEWETFAKAAHALARKEKEGYPSADDRCLLCERPLDASSLEHVELLLSYIEGEAQKTASARGEELESEIGRIRSLQIPDFSAESRVRTHMHRLDPVLEEQVAVVCGLLGECRAGCLKYLSGEDLSLGVADPTADIAALEGLKVRIESDIARLATVDVAVALAGFELERQTLRHREVLAQLLPQVEKQVSDAVWTAAANRKRNKLNTRPVTEKEKELFGEIVKGRYAERLAQECADLDCELPIELELVGRSGQTKRTLVMSRGTKPDLVLSEGEQKAVALADFLTEVALNPSNAGIILDDPVTSLDHQRKQLIASRLVRESRARQVVVFTHDLVFLNMMLEAAADETLPVLTHWVERENGTPGKIALGSSPTITRDFERTDRAKSALAVAKANSGSTREDALIKGMGALRTTLEVLVVRKLLKDAIVRWSDQIRVTTLRRVNWDNAKIDEVCDLYEELSRHIEGHSHTEEARGAPTEITLLEAKIAQVDALLTWARSDRT